MLTALPSRSVWAPPLPGSPNAASDVAGAGTSSLRPLSGSPAGAACIVTPPSRCAIYALPFSDKMSASFSQRQVRDGEEPELWLPPQPWPWRRRAQSHKAPRPLPAAPRGAGGGGPGPASRVRRPRVRAAPGAGPAGTARAREGSGLGLSEPGLGEGPRRRASSLGLRGDGAPGARCPALGEGRAGCGGAGRRVGSCRGEGEFVLV